LADPFEADAVEVPATVVWDVDEVDELLVSCDDSKRNDFVEILCAVF
jgi:hypothetical protein